jgi:putative nucleotidyltransferase with HDIG domain
VKRILFVDDETMVLDGFRRMLYARRNCWDMHFASSGEAALQVCQTGNFDVVITDMRMPGMDGATLLGHIRDRFPSTARVILSGYAEAAHAARSLPVAHRFLSKPCSEAELRNTIERLCALQELVDSPAIRKIAGTMSRLPSPSTTYTRLTRLVMDPNASISQVADIIQQDVAMSAKVLQLTNSAFFGLSQKIVSLTSAVAYLGMETIKNLALTFEAFKVLKADSPVPLSVYDSIQRHSIETAAVAGRLPLKRSMRDVTVVAALLHDIGSLFLASKMPDEFCSARLKARETGCQLFQAEEQLLGTSHAEIGAYLLRLWGIPNLAVEAVAHHHHPTRVQHSEFDSTVAVYVADLLAHELETSPQGSMGLQIAEYDRLCLDELGILSSLDEFRELASQTGK